MHCIVLPVAWLVDQTWSVIRSPLSSKLFACSLFVVTNCDVVCDPIVVCDRNKVIVFDRIKFSAYCSVICLCVPSDCIFSTFFHCPWWDVRCRLVPSIPPNLLFIDCDCNMQRTPISKFCPFRVPHFDIICVWLSETALVSLIFAWKGIIVCVCLFVLGLRLCLLIDGVSTSWIWPIFVHTSLYKVFI